MRKKRLILVIALALASGAVAGYSILHYLKERPTRLMASPDRAEKQPVVVAAQDLPVGSVVTEDQVKVVGWPGEAVPQGYARSPSEVVGRGVITEVRTNEALLDSKLGDASTGGGLPIVIPPGMRAVSVRVDEVIGVAGFVLPGTRVDVLVTITPPGSKDPVSKVILQNIQALAAGQEMRKDEEGEPMTVTVVTVLVDPEDAERLIHAASQGRIQMALRNTLDLESSETDGVRTSSLLSGSRSESPTPRARTGTTTGGRARPEVVEMYQGGVRTLISY